MPQEPSIFRRISPCVLAYIARNFAMPYIGAIIGFMALFMLVDSINGDMRDFLEENTKIKQEQAAWAAAQVQKKGLRTEGDNAGERVENIRPPAMEKAPRQLIPWSVIIMFLLAKQPQNLTYVIPFASLLAASFMTMMLGKNSELTAFRAAGMSLFTCCIPVWIIAGISCVVVFAINESWGPACLERADAIEMKYLKHGKAKSRAAFAFGLEHRDWLIDSLDLEGDSTGVIVRQYRPNGTYEYLLAAQSARYDGKWIFKDGFVKHYDTEGKPLLEAPKIFETLEKTFTESPENIRSHSIDRERMTIVELWEVLRSGLVTSMHELHLLKTILLYRCLFPLAALIGALFGVALTISNDRMGLMNGFAYAVGSMLLFYLITELGILCVKNGWLQPLGSLSPFLGGALPCLAFFAAAVTTMWRRA